MTMREYLGSVAPLSIETTVYLHTVRKGQGVDTTLATSMYPIHTLIMSNG